VLILKNKDKFLIVIFTIFFNLSLYILNFINYDSTRGTDYNLYGKYLENFIFNYTQSVQAQGVGYFWLVAKFIEINSKPLIISLDYKNLVFTHGIQIINFLFFSIGLFGIYFLLRKLKLSFYFSLLCINIISVFPPVVGTRLILKPEIVAVGFLPWLIFFIISFKENYDKKYLLFSFPIIALLGSLKASITLMVLIVIVIFLGKDLLRQDVLFFGFLTLIIMIPVILESQAFTGLYIWEHQTPESYMNKAPLSFLYLINSDLFTNPFRDTHANSMLGILLLDTFGDYWQRYWFHKDGWFNNQFPGNINSIRTGLVFSLIFYVSVLYNLIKEKSILMKKLGMIGFVGIFVMIVNVLNLIPFLTMNFNPAKGDPIKTQYFSFLLMITFLYWFIKITKENLTIGMIIFTGIFFFSIQLFNSAQLRDITSSQTLMNKVHFLSPCFLGDPLENMLNYSHSWCDQEKFAESVCYSDFNETLLPVQKEDYFIFPPDDSYENKNLSLGKNTITVANYYECINYIKGGFVPQEIADITNDSIYKTPKYFLLVLLLSLFMLFASNNKIFNLFINKVRKRN